MSAEYNKTIWQNGDVISVEKLNKIENGIAAVSNTVNSPAIYDTATGSIASFSDGADNMPVKSAVVTMEPIQDLHGYDNPWLAGGGANKLLFSDVDATNTVQSVTATWNVNKEELTLNGNNSGSYAIVINARASDNHVKMPDLQVGDTWTFGTDLPTGAYVGIVYKNTSNSEVQYWYILGNGTFKKVTLAVPDDFVSFDRIQVGINPSASFNSAKCHFAFVSGSTLIAWTPYSNICPISGRTGVSVVKAGKNLLWKSRQSSTMNGITWTLNDDGSITASGTSTGRSYIRIIVSTRDAYTLPKGTYTYSLTPTGSDYTNIYSLIGSYKGNKYYKNVCAVGRSNNFAKVFEWNDSDLAAVLDIFVEIERANKTVNCTVYPQIELGTNATAYEPYTGNTYSVNWETEVGTVYGGTLDVVSGKLVVDRAMVVIDGVNNIVRKNGATSTTSNAWFEGAVGKAYGRNNFISDRFTTGIGIVPGGMVGRDNLIGVEFLLPTDIPNNSTALNQWFADNPTQLCYELAEPIEIQLTPQEVRTLLGVNNVWSDAGDMAAEYPADTKLYIDRKIAEALS